MKQKITDKSNKQKLIFNDNSRKKYRNSYNTKSFYFEHWSIRKHLGCI